jgi:hypothetical protein
MGKSCAESILLIHRELLSDGKGLIRPVQYGISRGFAIRKEKGKIKGEKYRMLRTQNDLICLATNRFERNPNAPRKVNCL